jgi:hypothetical protein
VDSILLLMYILQECAVLTALSVCIFSASAEAVLDLPGPKRGIPKLKLELRPQSATLTAESQSDPKPVNTSFFKI